MNFHAAEQESLNWCWAACVQMVLSTRNVMVTQPEIVANVNAGYVEDRPGSPFEVLEQLDRWKSADGQWELEALIGIGPPSLELMSLQFEQKTPLIVAYKNPGLSVGHAVVVTAVIYEQTRHGPRIVKVLVRDPWPDFRSSSGKRELSFEEFQRIETYLLVLPVRATPLF
ncbi:papain-like cysteine protease family protein [Calycomorphotria hydatis]|nr:papain-like cysteine protease family protein [Calycomorphotria hydatis]